MPNSDLPHFLAQFERRKERWQVALRDNEKDQDNEETPLRNGVKELLPQIADDGRKASKVLDGEALLAFSEAAVELEHDIVEAAYSKEGDGFDFIPVICGEVVKDESSGIGVGVDAARELLAIMSQFSNGAPRAVSDFMSKMVGNRDTAYDKNINPHTSTNLLSRFSNVPVLASDAPDPMVAFSQARCEIRATQTPSPIRLLLKDGVLALIGCGGWKLRDPTLSIFKTEGENSGLSGGVHIDVGLQEIAHRVQLDSERRLVYVSDSHRVKSYRWEFQEDRYKNQSTPVHTFDSKQLSGDMILRNNGSQLLRFGTRGMGVWNIDEAPTHGADGTDIVGEEDDPEHLDSWRDNECDEIELSSGSPPILVSGAEALKNIDLCRAHSSVLNQIIAVYEKKYPPALVDIEAQKRVLRYVGHGGTIDSIATSKHDVHGFVTAASDGGVRLYDSRVLAPNLAIDHGTEMLYTALYEHIGGQPFIIIGGTKTQQIKVWDVRARKSLYELSTGNNDVQGLAWDEESQSLYAATECSYMDRMGSIHGYRYAKFPRERKEEEMDEDDDYDYNSDEAAEDDGLGWPKQAYHSEKSFGYPLDSGEHRIYRYQFKIDPDPKIMPEYGQASPEYEDSYW